MTIPPNSQGTANNLQTQSRQSLKNIFWILTLAAAGMAALLALLPAAGHDQLWFLMMARRWLAGAQLYGPEVFDSNPPLIVWLSAVPILLGHALHLSTTFTAKLLVTLLETGTSFLSLYFLRRARTNTRPYEIPALLFAAIALFYVVPARDFGQRDQILAFLILPYVLAAAISVRTHSLTLMRCLAGILAAAAICLKPHQALIPIAVELTLLFIPSALMSSERADQQKPRLAISRLRNLFRPETIFIVILGAAYLSAIHRLTPLYFTTALPILRDTYWAIGHLSIPALALEAIELLILAAVSIGLSIAHKLRSTIVFLLQTAAIAATIAYFLQGTGWYYQQLPAIDLFGAALTLQLLDLVEQKAFAIPRWLPSATAALSTLALALTTYFTGSPFTLDRSFAITSPDPAFFTTLAPGTPVAILTTSVDAAMMPIERYHLTWAQRTNNLWLLPAILRSETPGAGMAPNRILPAATIAQLDALQHRWMVEDLTRWRPTLILVDRCQKASIHCQELEDRDDDLVAFFLRDPAFAAIWSHYTFAGFRGEFDAYTLKP
jgi:hypothetical protein